MSFLPNFGELFWDTLIKDRQSVNSTMITPKLTAVMMAVTALIGAGPVAAFAQAANVQEIGDLVNAANIETGGNSQVNAAETTQTAVNNIEISNEAESGDAEAEGGDAEAEAEAEAESESETNQVNLLEDNDDVTAIQANVPIQAQLDPVAIDLELLLEGLAL